MSEFIEKPGKNKRFVKDAISFMPKGHHKLFFMMKINKKEENQMK